MPLEDLGCWLVSDILRVLCSSLHPHFSFCCFPSPALLWLWLGSQGHVCVSGLHMETGLSATDRGSANEGSCPCLTDTLSRCSVSRPHFKQSEMRREKKIFSPPQEPRLPSQSSCIHKARLHTRRGQLCWSCWLDCKAAPSQDI